MTPHILITRTHEFPELPARFLENSLGLITRPEIIDAFHGPLKAVDENPAAFDHPSCLLMVSRIAARQPTIVRQAAAWHIDERLRAGVAVLRALGRNTRLYCQFTVAAEALATVRMRAGEICPNDFKIALRTCSRRQTPSFWQGYQS